MDQESATLPELCRTKPASIGRRVADGGGQSHAGRTVSFRPKPSVGRLETWPQKQTFSVAQI
jgi:hypothetical protein